ncbi:MAG: tetratricopeptide repeat protein [Pseudobdellovibrionaceae bacterium]
MWKWSLAIVLITFGIYGNTINSSFLWDDQQFVLENQFLTSWHKLPLVFTNNIAAGAGIISNLYRPLQSVTHFFDIQVWGYWSPGHHLTNVILACIAAALLFQFLLSLVLLVDLKAKVAAFFITLLYVAHPLQSEIIGYVSGRGDSLAFIFLLVAGINFRTRFWLAAIATVLGILSKESGLLIPPFLLVYDFFTSSSKSEMKSRWYKHLLLWILVGIYLGLRFTVLNFHSFTNFYGQENILTQNHSYRIFTYFASFAKGLQIWIWPTDLHHERNWMISSHWYEWLTVCGALLWTSMLGAAAWLWKKAPLISFGCLWFIGATIPTSNLLIIINALFYDHWFVLPGLGFCFILLHFYQAFLAQKKWSRGIQAVLILSLSCLLGVEIWATQIQNRIWKNPQSLFEHILKYNPGSTKMMNNLAMELSQQGKNQEAKELYLRAIKTSDEYPQTHHNLALIYISEQNFSEALNELKKAIQLDEGFYQSWTYTGLIQLHQNKLNEAAASFRKSLEIHPTAQAQKGLEQALKPH